jgi:hypothetical protein
MSGGAASSFGAAASTQPNTHSPTALRLPSRGAVTHFVVWGASRGTGMCSPRLSMDIIRAEQAEPRQELAQPPPPTSWGAQLPPRPGAPLTSAVTEHP